MAVVERPTNLDPQGRSSWHIDDALVRLRLWGSDHAYHLPEQRVPLKIGTAATCEIRLQDASGLLSREHALLVPERAGWEIRDLASKNGVKVEGTPTLRGGVLPGVKIQIGGLVLVAESLKFLGLRSLMCRLLGWGARRQTRVDEALQNVRDCAIQRTPLLLIGDGELAPVAARLQRATLGPSAPFVTHPGGSGGVDISAAIQAAMGGSLCVSLGHRAAAAASLDAIHATDISTRPRLVLCARTEAQAAAVTAKPGRLAVISIPPLTARADEISRLVHETALDIVGELGAPSTGFSMHDLERLGAIKFLGIADMEDCIRRLITLRTWGVTAGGKRLGLKHSSLSQWARHKNRGLTT